MTSRHVLGLVVAAVLAVGLAGCGRQLAAAGQKMHSSAAASRIERIIPAPAGLVGLTAPEPNGTIWVLAGNARVKALTEVNLLSGKPVMTIGVDPRAESVAESPTGLIALGLAGRGVGAVQFVMPPRVLPTGVVPVGGPVRSVEFSQVGKDLYALDASRHSASVSVVSAYDKRLVRTLGVSKFSIGCVPNPASTAVFCFDAHGTIQQTLLRSDQLVQSYSLSRRLISAVVSPLGSPLYVLAQVGSSWQILVIDPATEQLKKVLPAPAHAVALAISPDGRTLYIGVGTPHYGNLQVLEVEPPLSSKGGLFDSASKG